MKPFNNKNILIILAAVAAILLGLLGYSYIKNVSSKSTVPPTVRTKTPEDTKITLPYSGDGFSINYLEGSGVYVVSIYSQPVEEKKQIALTYLNGYGITPAKDKIEYFYGPDVSESVGP